MVFRLLILVIQLKKTDYNTKIDKIEKKITDHDHSNRYIITQEFNTLTSENFADFVKMTDFDDKVKI